MYSSRYQFQNWGTLLSSVFGGWRAGWNWVQLSPTDGWFLFLLWRTRSRAPEPRQPRQPSSSAAITRRGPSHFYSKHVTRALTQDHLHSCVDLEQQIDVNYKPRIKLALAVASFITALFDKFSFCSGWVLPKTWGTNWIVHFKWFNIFQLPDLRLCIAKPRTSNNMQKYEDFPVLPVLAFHCRVESAIMFCTGRH